MVSVNAHPGEGHRSRYRMPGSDVSMKTVDGILSVRAKIGSPVGLPAIGAPAVELDLHFDITAQPPLTVISDLDTDPPAVSTTGKNAALPVNGRVVIRHGGARKDQAGPGREEPPATEQRHERKAYNQGQFRSFGRGVGPGRRGGCGGCHDEAFH